jgi:3-dehydroquinate synthase
MGRKCYHAQFMRQVITTRGPRRDCAMIRPMMKLTIRSPQSSYSVAIENGMLGRAGSHLRRLFGKQSDSQRRIFIVTVAPVRRRWGKKLIASLAAAGFTSTTIEMPDGERYKKLDTIEKLAGKLVSAAADRSSIIVAFGGGVVGDVAGMLASLYMRGIALVQVPTTVLAQLDASVGGKTGVNLSAGKNLLGTFYHPRAVIVDPELLSTLPEREFRAGLYEAVKCGIIGDPELFRIFEAAPPHSLRAGTETVESIIYRSLALKARVVSADERETGVRQILNFGHTIGHALEAETEYRHFLHGEAVAWGMIAATQIAVASGHLKRETGTRTTDAILKVGPLPKVRVSTNKILKLIKHDKKSVRGVVHFVLPAKIGEVKVVNDVPESAVKHALDHLRHLSLKLPKVSQL